MKKVITLILVICTVTVISAQELVSTSGAYFENGSGSISYSIGEVATITLSDASGQLTQGFQQPILTIVEAGMSLTSCKTNFIDLNSLGASVLPLNTAATWSTNGTGTFNDTNSQTGVFGSATVYQPGIQDIADGKITLTLTADVEGISDQVQIFILNVDCGDFPWDGN